MIGIYDQYCIREPRFIVEDPEEALRIVAAYPERQGAYAEEIEEERPFALPPVGKKFWLASFWRGNTAIRPIEPVFEVKHEGCVIDINSEDRFSLRMWAANRAEVLIEVRRHASEAVRRQLDNYLAEGN